MRFHASTKTLNSSMTKGTLSKRLGGITKGTPGQRSALLQVCVRTPSLWISINISRPITSSTSSRKQRTLLLSHCDFINRRRKDERVFLHLPYSYITQPLPLIFHPCRNGAVRWRPPCGETVWAMTQQFSLLNTSLSVKSENSSKIWCSASMYLRYSGRTLEPER